MPEAAELERRTTGLLQQLIRLDTVNPPGNEERVQHHLQGMLLRAGFEVELLSAVRGRPNLVARLRGRSDGPVLCYLCHADTVLADPSEWRVDPWSGELLDGHVWGRGALDMKDQVAAEVVAALALAEEGWRPEAGELLIVVTADEEAGAIHGAKWLCEQHPDKVRCDYVVNEGGGASFVLGGRRWYSVGIAEKGVYRFTLETTGHAGHASIPRLGDNALVKLAPIITALAPGYGPQSVGEVPAATFAALGVSSLEEIEDPRVAAMVEPLLGVTFTPSMVHASDKINVTPSRAQLRVDCRVPPGEGEVAVTEALEAMVGHSDYRVRFDEQVSGNASPVETPLMDRIREFVDREDPGAGVVPMGLPGFTDSHWFRAAFPGCVAYGFMPARSMDYFEAAALMHAPDERVPVEDLGLAVRFFHWLAPEVLG